jgi:hypothetical protein
MYNGYMESLPTYYEIKFWTKPLKWGRESIKDDPKFWCSVEASNMEICDQEEVMIIGHHIEVLVLVHRLETS